MSTNSMRSGGPRRTVKEHCEGHALLIPEQLGRFADAHLFMTDRESSIFYKNLEHDLRGIEFYTSQPCLTYIIDGQETFTSFDNDDVQIAETEMLLMPRNMYLVSDFRSAFGPLKSFIFFFGDGVLEEFLADTKGDEKPGVSVDGPSKIKSSSALNHYMSALRRVYKPRSRLSAVLRIKLLELLYLLHEQDRSGTFRATISNAHSHARKRNIARLMSEHFLRDLTVKDYAELSGRSLSTFSREFRRIFNKSPQQWLIEARLEHARNLVLSSDLSITEIAYSVGYDNVSHFIKTFRVQFGNTPKQLRQVSPEFPKVGG
jgi:AraC-like DNA-binding protein